MPSHHRVLIVEQVIFVRRMLKSLLTAEGLRCYEASSHYQAMDRFRVFRPEVVIVGTLQSPLASVMLVEALRTHDPYVRVVMCSGQATRAMVVESVRAGAVDFVVRPFRLERLMAAVTGRPMDDGMPAPRPRAPQGGAPDAPPALPPNEPAEVKDIKVTFLPSELDLVAF